MTPLDVSERSHMYPSSFYEALYKCDRCGHEWRSVNKSPPLDSVPCIFGLCSNPPFLVFLIRNIKRQKLGGYGKLIEVTVYVWEDRK